MTRPIFFKSAFNAANRGGSAAGHDESAPTRNLFVEFVWDWALVGSVREAVRGAVVLMRRRGVFHRISCMIIGIYLKFNYFYDVDLHLSDITRLQFNLVKRICQGFVKVLFFLRYLSHPTSQQTSVNNRTTRTRV